MGSGASATLKVNIRVSAQAFDTVMYQVPIIRAKLRDESEGIPACTAKCHHPPTEVVTVVCTEERIDRPLSKAQAALARLLEDNNDQTAKDRLEDALIAVESVLLADAYLLGIYNNTESPKRCMCGRGESIKTATQQVDIVLGKINLMQKVFEFQRAHTIFAKN